MIKSKKGAEHPPLVLSGGSILVTIVVFMLLLLGWGNFVGKELANDVKTSTDYVSRMDDINIWNMLRCVIWRDGKDCDENRFGVLVFTFEDLLVGNYFVGFIGAMISVSLVVIFFWWIRGVA